MVSTRNPFPGMNPFLEQGWSDTHTLLIGYIRDALAQGGLPVGLRARAEESLSIDEAEEAPQSARADLAVVESWRKGIAPVWNPEREAPAVALASPSLVLRESGVERWVEITTAHGRLVTVLEVLSPSKKTGPGGTATRGSAGPTRRRASTSSRSICSGRQAPTVAAETPARFRGTRYTICVFRAAKPDRFEVYHWGLCERIPAFAVPLRANDPDVPLTCSPSSTGLTNSATTGRTGQTRPSSIHLWMPRRPPSPRSGSAPPDSRARRRGMVPNRVESASQLCLVRPGPVSASARVETRKFRNSRSPAD